MGAGASVGEVVDSVNAELTNLKQFVDCFGPLAEKGKKALATRKQSWIACDPNGNGYVSLAEYDAWIKKTLEAFYEKEEGERLWKLFRPTYILAWTDGKDLAENKEIAGTDGLTTDDYLTRYEFRVANAYLCIYAAMYDCFAKIDGVPEGVPDVERKMTEEEWKEAYPKKCLDYYGFAALAKIANKETEDSPESVFKEMDADGKGAVLLGEWCKFLEKAEIAAGTTTGKLLAKGDDDAPAPKD